MLALIYRITSAAGQHVTRCLVLLVITIVAVDGVIFILVELTQCMPLSLFWTPSFTPQNCINQADHLLAAGIINTVTDFIIVLLPIKTILGLNLPRRQLVGIQVLLGGGVLATIVGAVRVYFTWESHEAADGDITWRSHLVIALSALELYIGIVRLLPNVSSMCFMVFYPYTYRIPLFVPVLRITPCHKAFLRTSRAATLWFLQIHVGHRAAQHQEKQPKARGRRERHRVRQPHSPTEQLGKRPHGLAQVASSRLHPGPQEVH